MPVIRNADHSQFVLTPPVRTRSVTRFGVSAEKVVATIEGASSHHGAVRRKGNIVEAASRAAAKRRPMASDSTA